MGEHRLKNQDFRQAISEVRAELERHRMPAAAASRVRAQIERQAARPARQRLPRAALLAAGVAVALVVVYARRGSERALQLPAGFEAVGRSPDLQLVVEGAPPAVAVRAGSCTLGLRGWGRITAQAGTQLRRRADGVELLSGVADFQVDKRAPGSGSTHVRLAQGVIEITGTHFSVVERADGGTAHLFEGEIRFHAPDGRTVTLAPGQSIRWPLAPEPAAPPDAAPAAAASPAAAPAREPTATAIVDKISALRAKRQYRELADELERLMSVEKSARTRERESFELGTVLSYHLPDRTRACAHWARHARAFPAGRYAPEIADAQETLHCDGGESP
ncbi:MAG TPA: FecR domain-containing protein [Polyangia bacterium]|nr:FecR domain-containing protein [Polyangia bacterium]